MRILVATDLSEFADEALRQAQAWEGDESELAACHVLPNLQPESVLYPQSTEQTIGALSAIPARAEAAVRERVASVTGRAPNRFEVFVDQGVGYAEIARRASAWKADLVVIASHGHTGLKHILLGSVADRVMRYAPCPVLVARPGSPRTGPIVAATDLSDPSLPTLTAGSAAAARMKAPLTVVHAIDVGPPSTLVAGAPFGILPMTYSAQAFAEVEAAAKAALTRALKNAGTDAEARVVSGDAATAIVQEAEARQARLVIVGTHGRTGFARIALGSVAEKVAHTAPCSVLVVRLTIH